MNPEVRPSAGPAILAIRLGAMGDIIHAMPAVHALKRSHADSSVCWLVEPRWAPLLEGNSFLTDIALLDRSTWGSLRASVQSLRSRRFDIVVDFQGLLKSALPAWLVRSPLRFGFASTHAREPLASWFYTDRVTPTSRHIVNQFMDLAGAAGATDRTVMFDFGPGVPEADLPPGGFVLANPLAGWLGKQWPLERWTELAGLIKQKLDLPLVLNGAPRDTEILRSVAGVWLHLTGIRGLMYATRRATAAVGLDSGPMHLAAAMGVPGVALFGPTDPARNGPYGDTFHVLRDPAAVTSYKRRPEIDPAMRAISAAEVASALEARLAAAKPSMPLRPATW